MAFRYKLNVQCFVLPYLAYTKLLIQPIILHQRESPIKRPKRIFVLGVYVLNLTGLLTSSRLTCQVG